CQSTRRDGRLPTGPAESPFSRAPPTPQSCAVSLNRVEPPGKLASVTSICSTGSVFMSVFLGIDVGTSGTKTLAITDEGAILATSTEEYPLHSPRPGWSEQEPE